MSEEDKKAAKIVLVLRHWLLVAIKVLIKILDKVAKVAVAVLAFILILVMLGVSYQLHNNMVVDANVTLIPLLNK